LYARQALLLHASASFRSTLHIVIIPQDTVGRPEALGELAQNQVPFPLVWQLAEAAVQAD
jgi:hypothetical protein